MRGRLDECKNYITRNLRGRAQEWSPLHCAVHVREVGHLSYQAVRASTIRRCT